MIMNTSISLPPDSNTPIPGICVLIILSMIVLGISLPLTIHVLWQVITSVRNGVASEFFSLNLCVCEIIICFNDVFAVFDIVFYNNDTKSPLYILLTFSFMMHTISRPIFQCCVCVERYVAVIHPIIFLKYKPPRYRTALSLVAWIIVLGISVVCLFLSLGNILYYILLPEYLLIVSIKILCSVAVLKALRKPRPGEKLSEKDAESNHIKKKAFWVIMIILVCMFITYCPIMIIMLIYGYLSGAQQSMCMIVLSFFLVFGGFVDPFLYLHRVGKLPLILGLELFKLH